LHHRRHSAAHVRRLNRWPLPWQRQTTKIVTGGIEFPAAFRHGDAAAAAPRRRSAPSPWFCWAGYSGWRGDRGVTGRDANQLRASGESVPLLWPRAWSSSRPAPCGGSLLPFSPCQPVHRRGTQAATRSGRCKAAPASAEVPVRTPFPCRTLSGTRQNGVRRMMPSRIFQRTLTRRGGPAVTAKPLVAATDGSEGSLRAVEWAAREAVLRGTPLRIVSTVQVAGNAGPKTVP